MLAIGSFFSTESMFYWFVYGLMIIFFCYFYTAIVMDPNQLSDNMKKHGGFIPGVRPGPRNLPQYIDGIMTRITCRALLPSHWWRFFPSSSRGNSTWLLRLPNFLAVQGF